MKEFSKKYSENCAYDVDFFFEKKCKTLHGGILLIAYFFAKFPRFKDLPGSRTKVSFLIFIRV